MLFFLTETWPLTSSVDVGKEAMKLASTPLPRYMKMHGPWVTLGGDGVKSYTIYEVKKGHEDEGYKVVVKRLAGMFSIEGFKASTEVVLPMVEALPFVGLSL